MFVNLAKTSLKYIDNEETPSRRTSQHIGIQTHVWMQIQERYAGLTPRTDLLAYLLTYLLTSLRTLLT